MVFNALKYVEILRNAGIPDKQAEAQVRVLNEVMESDLATKRDITDIKRDITDIKRDITNVKKDIEDLKQTTKKDIEGLRQSTKRDLKELEQRMLIKLGSLLVIALTAMAAFLK